MLYHHARKREPFQGGGVELALVLELLEKPGLYESAPPRHHCYALVLTHAPVGLQQPCHCSGTAYTNTYITAAAASTSAVG